MMAFLATQIVEYRFSFYFYLFFRKNRDTRESRYYWIVSEIVYPSSGKVLHVWIITNSI